MVESKFTFWTLFAIISSVVFCVILLFSLLKFGWQDLPIYASVPLFILLTSIIVWILLGELRTKAIKVNMTYNDIFVTGYLGLGITKKYNFSEFDGYKFSILQSEHRDFEYLYLLVNGRAVIKISQFYHSNYTELKQIIIKKVKNLGKEDFSLTREIKSVFRAWFKTSANKGSD